MFYSYILLKILTWLCNKVETRKNFRFHYFWLYFVYQNFQNGYFRISLFSILLEVICGKWILKLEYVEVVLLRCNLVSNNYQQASKVLITFVPNKQFGQLIDISTLSLIILNTTNTEFSLIEVWFTDQTPTQLEYDR